MSMRDRLFGNRKKLNQIEDATIDLEEKAKGLLKSLHGDNTVQSKACAYCHSKNPVNAGQCWNCKNSL
jgi:ribosomal protein L40E